MPRYRPKPKKMAMSYYDPWTNWNATYSGTSSSAVTWNHWINANYGTTAASNVTIWSNWVTPGNYPPTGSTITTQVWNAWVDSQARPNRYHDPQTLYHPPQLTPEQLEEQRLAREEANRKAAERQQRQIEAKARAKALLLDHLSPVQKREYEEKGSFKVEVGSRTFQIMPGTHGNVKELHVENGREIVIRSFCIPSRRADLPEPDVHLSQKLMLEGGRDTILDFHRIANITEYRPELKPRLDRELQPA